MDANGNKIAVVLDFAVWEEILDLLEDLEDAEEVSGLRQLKEEAVEWNTTFARREISHSL